jgi:hypothetical protein
LAELVGQINKVIVVTQKQPWMLSDLLLAIREVDEVIHLQEEIVVCGTSGGAPCDLLSNPILTEENPGALGL